MTFGWIGWAVVVPAAWFAVASLVGTLLGRAVRRRDRQIPRRADEQDHPRRGR